MDRRGFVARCLAGAAAALGLGRAAREREMVIVDEVDRFPPLPEGAPDAFVPHKGGRVPVDLAMGSGRSFEEALLRNRHYIRRSIERELERNASFRARIRSEVGAP